MAEKVYVTYTCKNKDCRKAFIDIDINNNINEVPLQNRYCPDCVKNGFKNEKQKRKTKEELIAEDNLNFFLKQIEENNIEDKKDIAFLKKEFFKNIKTKTQLGCRINRVSLFKQAVEVLGYQDWKS